MPLAPRAAPPTAAAAVDFTDEAADRADSDTPPAACSTFRATTDGSPSEATSRSMRIDTSANQAAINASTVHEPMKNTPITPA